MDDLSFDRLARTLAACTSRRSVLKFVAGGAGSGLLGLVGWRSRRVGAQECPPGTESCGGTCVAACPDGQALDQVSCDCVCGPSAVTCGGACVDTGSDPSHCGGCGIVCGGANATVVCIAGVCTVQGCAPGFADCDGDAVNGCETALATVEHCLDCGDACQDTGEACTEPACGPSEGCGVANVADGTPCGFAGACQSGACVECVPGGSCQGDADCCGGDVCCEAACVSPAGFVTDPEHCGGCGRVCPNEPCRIATCVAGACQSTPVDDGVVCGDNEWCRSGQCVEGEDGPAVVSLTLINADTEADIGPLVDGDTLDLAALPTKNLNVRANTDQTTVGSVRFGYDANPEFRMENGAPYALVGNSGRNYEAWTPTPGTHTITATCYAQADGQGAAGRTLAVRFTVTEGDDEPDGPTVTALVLVDADSGQDIGPIDDGSTLDLSALPSTNLNVRADTDPSTVGSVRFGYDDNENYRTENSAPYTLAGDSGGTYEPWTPEAGEHTLTVTAYPERNASGAAGEPVSVRFTVIEGDDPQGGTLFRDGFETGDLSRWTSASNVVVRADVVAAGQYAARATSTGSATFLRHALTTTQDEVYVRVRFRLLDQGNNPLFLLRTRMANVSPLLGVQIGSNGTLSLLNSVLGQSTFSNVTVEKNRWHELQLRVLVDGGSSETELWFNDSRVAELSGPIALNAGDIGMIQIGDESSNRRFDIVFDDVDVATEKIPPADSVPEPEPEPGGTSTAPGANKSVLLATYTFRGSGGVDYGKVFYLPRRFGGGFSFSDPSLGSQVVDEAGPYAGWDVFPTYNFSVHRVESRADWIVLEVNRGATVAIVWRGGATVPGWLASWTKGSDVLINGKAFPTYRKSFPAGAINLGGVYNPGESAGSPRNTYWVLLAEADGKGSPAPLVPGGGGTPQPNQTCPTWVHDQYTAVAPDGRSYPTWHHQIDPIYWCYHRHEHGSNPAAFSPTQKPLYGYVNAAHGMSEPHTGFKTMVFDDASGNRWMLTMHFGTAGLGRACERFHSVGISVVNRGSGELLADLHLMGDFGRAVINTTQAVITPAACPDQAQRALNAGSRGIRQIASQADRAVNYEPWRIDDPRTILGITGTFTVNNPDAIVICDNSSCNQAVQTGQSGSKRFLTPNDGFGIVAGSNAGTFYTDALGMKLMSAGQAGAVRQYVKPGVSLSVPPQGGTAGHCYDVNAWGKPLVCGANFAQPTSREGSIQPPN